MLKTIGLGVTTAFIGLSTFSASALANEQDLLLTGFLDVAAGYAHQDCDEGGFCDAEDDDYQLFQGDARVNVPITNHFSFQLDLGTIQTNADTEVTGSRNALFDSYVFAGGHLAYRDPERFALGVFGLVGLSDGIDTGVNDANIDLYGIEGQVYFGAFTLYGQAGYFEADDGDNQNVMTHAYFARGEGRYFFNENSMVSAELSYVEGNENNTASGGEDPDGWSWGGRFQQAVAADTRLSWFVAYNGTRLEDDTDEVTEHTGLIGLRFQLGGNGPSLKDNDRRGATFSMPDVGRWTAWTMDVVD